MGPRPRRYAPLEDPEPKLLMNSQRASALVAEASPRYCPALPSPSLSPVRYYPTFASAHESTADHTYSPTSVSQTFPTPRSTPRNTWNCQLPAENEEYVPYVPIHASSSTLLNQYLPTSYTPSPRPPEGNRPQTRPTQQTEQITEDVAIGAEALFDLHLKASAVDTLKSLRTLKSSDDSTDDEEGATVTTTTRFIVCHGNTYLNLVPHAGCARWELTGQPDPASIDAQHNKKASTPTLEDHNGELDCPRCNRFERSRTKSRNNREGTLPLSEDAEDCNRRTGAAKYKDAHYNYYRYRLRKRQLKRQNRYIELAEVNNIIQFHTMKPETRAKREREKAARVEQEREAPYERAYAQRRAVSDGITARIQAQNKAEYELEKQAMGNPKPKLSFEDYLDSLPAPDPENLKVYKEDFVPTNDMIIPPPPTPNVDQQGTSSGRTRNKPKPKRKVKAKIPIVSPPTDSTPSPTSNERIPSARTTPSSANKSSASPTKRGKGPVPANKKRKASFPIVANKRTKHASTKGPPPPKRTSPRTKKPDGRQGMGASPGLKAIFSTVRGDGSSISEDMEGQDADPEAEVARRESEAVPKIRDQVQSFARGGE